MTGSEPRARLVCRSGALSGETFDLGAETRIGRAPGNDLVLESPSVSKRHALIARREGEFFLEDLDSTHGTRLDGRPVTEPVRLHRMHVIELSDVEFVYTRLPARKDADAAESGSAGARSGGEEPRHDEPSSGPAEEGATIVDQGGFGTLPDLGGAGGSGGSDDGEGRDGPEGTDRGEAPDGTDGRTGSGGGDGPEEGATIVDQGGFGTLPDLDDDVEEAGSDEGAAESDDPSGPGDPSGPDDGPEKGATIVDSGGFGALPDLDDAEPGEPDAPAGAPPDEERGGAPDDSDEERAESPAEPAAPPEPSADRPRTRRASAGAPEASPVELLVSYPDGRSVTVPLERGDNVLGRSDECDVALDDPDLWLSRKHAVVRVKPDGVELVDLASVNGTFVGGKRVEEATLTPGTSFHLGPHLELQLRTRS